jgi:hypothetical protein
MNTVQLFIIMPKNKTYLACSINHVNKQCIQISQRENLWIEAKYMTLEYEFDISETGSMKLI